MKDKVDTCDVIVVGSGAGGLATAVVAAHNGLDVLVVEKEPVLGGTTAWSGGWLWIPRNPLAVRGGIVEDAAGPRRYLASELGNAAEDPRVDVFLANGPEMVRFFEEETEVAFIDGNKVPDFHATPGHATGGRSVAAAPYDGRGLGDWVAKLRPPLDVISVLGMGIASGADLNHFVNATRSVASARHAAARFLRHGRDLAVHGRGMQLVNGNALVARLLRSALDRDVAIRTEAPVEALIVEGGRVVGSRLGGSAPGVVRARRGVVLATGGFPHDPARMAALFEHAKHHSAAPVSNTGDGLRLGEAAGGTVADDLVNSGAWAPVSLVPRPDGSVARFPHLVERAKPGFIAVDTRGRRFVNEADSYHDFMSGLFRATPTGEEPVAWLIADHRAQRRWGLGWAKPFPFPLRPYLRSGYLKRGRTLAELARACGLDPAALEATVAAFNANARAGDDPEFGRGRSPYNRVQGDAAHRGPNPSLGPLEKAPFYAVRIVAGSLGTFAGLRTDAAARVLGRDGAQVPGLFAVGNDMSSIMGGNYPSGGITLGPAMTFGYVAGRVLAGLPVDGLDPHDAGQEIDAQQKETLGMSFYEIATLKTVIFGIGKVAPAVEAWVDAPEAKGRLLGAFASDIGELNNVYLFRGFDSLEDLAAERDRALRSDNPFGCVEHLVDMSFDSYRPLDFLSPVEPGKFGPFYELRSYRMKLNGLMPTMGKWEGAVPGRSGYSPLTIAMYALDGAPRLTQLWPYQSLEARAKARSQSFADGAWPAKGGPDWLTPVMTSTIAMPLAFSPLQ